MGIIWKIHSPIDCYWQSNLWHHRISLNTQKNSVQLEIITETVNNRIISKEKELKLLTNKNNRHHKLPINLKNKQEIKLQCHLKLKLSLYSRLKFTFLFKIINHNNNSKSIKKVFKNVLLFLKFILLLREWLIWLINVSLLLSWRKSKFKNFQLLWNLLNPK